MGGEGDGSFSLTGCLTSFAADIFGMSVYFSNSYFTKHQLTESGP